MVEGKLWDKRVFILSQIFLTLSDSLLDHGGPISFLALMSYILQKDSYLATKQKKVENTLMAV